MTRNAIAQTVALLAGLSGSAMAQPYPQQVPAQYPADPNYNSGPYAADPAYGGAPYEGDPGYAGSGNEGIYAPRPPQAPNFGYGRPPMPGPNFIWIDGYWNFVAGRYLWVGGYWMRPPYAGSYWIGPRWTGGRFFAGFWGRGRFDDERREYNEHRFGGNGFRGDFRGDYRSDRRFEAPRESFRERPPAARGDQFRGGERGGHRR